MVLVKVFSIFFIILIGLLATKIGWLKREVAKPLSKIVINIAAPCVVLTSMLKEERTSEKIGSIVVIMSLVLIFLILSFLLAQIYVKVAKVKDDEQGIYKNFFLFTNNGFLGFPIALTIFGTTGMFPMVIANVLTIIGIFTLGIHNLHTDKLISTKERILHIFSFPVITSLLAIVFFLTDCPCPDFIFDILEMIGGTMAPLSMIVIGIQLLDSHPLRLIKNFRLITVSIIRLVIIPIITFFSLIFLREFFPFLHLTETVIGVITLNFLLPLGAVPAALAEDYTKKGTLAAEGVFLSTLLSIVSISIWTFVLA